MQAQSGELDVVSAIRKAVAEMAGGGLRVVDYASGHTNRMDVAVRRAVLSGIKDTARETSRMRGEEMGVTIWEISAHSGARPTHQKWQGKRFDTTGTYYPTEQELTHGTKRLRMTARHPSVPDKDAPLYMEQGRSGNKIDPAPFVLRGKNL